MGSLSRRYGGLKGKGKSENYSALRSGAVDFIESAVGVGDELDALIRRTAGDYESYDEALDESRQDLDYFEKKNKWASGALTVAGVGASLFVPGLTTAKLATASTKVGRAAQLGAAGAIEGSIYGYLTGRDEERLTSAATGAALGGVLGGAVGGFLTKSADDVAKIKTADDAKRVGKGSHIFGEAGVIPRKQAAVEKRTAISKTETSANKRKVNTVSQDVTAEDVIGNNSYLDTVDSVYQNGRTWGYKRIGERATSLVERAETGGRIAKADYGRKVKDQTELLKPLEDSVDLTEGVKNIGIIPDSAVSARLGLPVDAEGKATRAVMWDDVIAKASTPEEELAVRTYRDLIEEIRADDLGKWLQEGEYAPRGKGAASAEGKGALSEYASPTEALIEYADDVIETKVLADVFKIDPNDITRPKDSEIGRLDAAIRAVQKKALDEAGSDQLSADLGNLLRSTMIAGRTGGDALGAIARKTASAALLANPVNALLNMGETLTAPVIQNGFKAWAQSIKGTTLSMLGRKPNGDFISAEDIGITDAQYAGELMNSGKKTAAKWADWAANKLYKYTGTSKSHTATQEMLSNSSVNRALNLIKDSADRPQALEKLRKHDGMKGLTDFEFDQTVAALKKYKQVGIENLTPDESQWVRYFSGVSANRWQALSPMSMPKAFLDNPNGRIFYSMLSYMNVNLNNLHNNVGMKLMDVKKYGINTKEGQEAAREAAKYAAAWSALFGVVAGVWDDGRKTLYSDSDYKLEDILTLDGAAKAMANQMASNLSGGLVNIRAEEYGGRVIDPIPAPISLGLRGANAIASGVQGEVDPALRFLQSSVPVFSQADRLSRMGMFDTANINRMKEGRPLKGSRLFEGLIDE